MQIRNDVLLFNAAVTNNEIKILSGIQILSTLSFEFAKSPLSSFPDHKTHSFFAFEEETSLAMWHHHHYYHDRHKPSREYQLWPSQDNHMIITRWSAAESSSSGIWRWILILSATEKLNRKWRLLTNYCLRKSTTGEEAGKSGFGIITNTEGSARIYCSQAHKDLFLVCTIQ